MNIDWPEEIEKDETPLMNEAGEVKPAWKWVEELSEDEFIELCEVPG